MAQVSRGHLLAGIIFGDQETGEYIYLPGGEVGVEDPVCIFETADGQRDVPIQEAVFLIAKLTLKPVRHPRMGLKAY
ncbi:MAG: hypothetical protein H6Q65_2178 [Firmicutes bacterium]|nr:hypothetical protein [Bacillota bacterium]